MHRFAGRVLSPAVRALACAALVTAASPVAAQEALVDRLSKAGIAACRGIVVDAVAYAAGRQPHNTAWVSNNQSPNTRALHAITVVKYDDTPQIAAVTGAPRAGGGCDMTMTQVFFQTAPCAQMRKESEPAWRHVTDVNGAQVLAEADSRGGIMHLVEVPGGCMVVKSTTAYPDAPAR